VREEARLDNEVGGGRIVPKIRGVKPEFWTDDDICELSAFARLLFIGMWNFACDNGHLQDKPKQIKRRVLPSDDVNCTELIAEIEAAGLIERSDGWITVTHLTEHQKPDIRYFTTCDKEGCEDPPEKVSQREARRAHGGRTTGARRAHTVRTAGAHVDGDGDGDGDNSCASDDTQDRFEEFWNTYGKKVDRKKAEQKYKLALKKPGVTADLLISSARSYVEFQQREGKHPQFTKDPTTWLNGECWNNELTAPRVLRAAPEQSGPDGYYDIFNPPRRRA
jgi:hypothetical protein